MRLTQAMRLALAVLLLAVTVSANAQEKTRRVPHGQSRPPGPPLEPQEALAKMEVPEGFEVELVASEPQIVNPVAMTFDERGRVWVTESFEYPRKSDGPGRDRIKVLEDTDGDGKMDKVTVFAEGLNIPSGIAVGYGGVWVANAPDILFLEDTDGDGQADRREVVVTGFGRTDTHELPNSFTWGPDGWLYGLNGVFNHSHVKQGDREYRFTCAMFRIHPRTRRFELFAEGTSNPWGIAFDGQGSAFVSACVIDHLWHITQTGYYHRQAGAYPPFTWKIGSIVSHKHQKAAYCGIHWFDSDAYPEEYREQLYMGNIHGNCVNSDTLERNGSTYFARPRPDFLTANDAWFMPVVQKTGPDGCLYVLDWYDSYHCYQDARADPEGIDRERGRLYRIRYRATPRMTGFDLARESDEQLIDRLGSPNVYFRSVAQRLLSERAGAETREKLRRLVLDDDAPQKARMHALWALVGGGELDTGFHLELLGHPEAAYRAWGVRAAANAGRVEAAVRERVAELAADESPEVLLQVAIAARKVEGLEPVDLLLRVARQCGEDELIPHIVWENLYPLLEGSSDAFLRNLAEGGGIDAERHPGLTRMMPHAVERIVALGAADPGPAAELLELLTREGSANETLAGHCLAAVAERVQSGEIKGERLDDVKQVLLPVLGKLLRGPADGPLYLDAALLATTFGDARGRAAAREVFASAGQPRARRLEALSALIAAGGDSLLEAVEKTMADREANPAEFRGEVLSALGRLDEEEVAGVVLEHYARLEPELKPRAIELLTTRAGWAKRLLAAIEKERVPREALNVNQVRSLLASPDEKLAEAVRAAWGTIRTERDPEREKLIARMRDFIRDHPGDAIAGEKVFKKVCGQCHKMYGEGVEVGPDITRNGRNSFGQLLSNVFDPSLVIGAAYQARTVVTLDGRVLTGLPVEDSPQRVVLKVQGGKQEIIPRDNVDVMKVSKLSMMPEGLEKQLKPDELADLFAYLVLDKPPGDPTARQLPGVRKIEPRETTNPKEFDALLAEVAPGFTVPASGERGVALLEEHAGRPVVVRTHPVNRETPCVLRGKFAIPQGKRTRLELAVSHHERGDWQLVVKANGEMLHRSIVGPKTAADGWRELSIDLTRFAGGPVELEILNQPNDWAWEFAYWGRVAVVSE